MSAIVDIYTDAVHDNLRPMYANWQPGMPVELGDYGVLNGNHFIHVGNVADLGIKFTVRTDKSKDQINFSSKGSTKVTLNAAGTGGSNVKANLQIDFSSEESVFFNAAECGYDMIEDKAALGADVMKRFKGGTWEREWAVITDIVNAGATTIAVSGGTSSSVVFQASGNVSQIDLANASLSLSVVSSSNVALQIATQQGLSPLISLSKIQHTFMFFGNKFGPAALMMNDLSLARRVGDISKVEDDSSSNPDYFGQLLT
jgi:hypothetical protein